MTLDRAPSLALPPTEPPDPPDAPGAPEPADQPEPAEPIESVLVVPWADPVIDQLGHDPRSAYVERFWLGILGPSTVWLLRRLAAGLDEAPEGYRLSLPDTARALGIAGHGGKHSPFMRTLTRSCQFGMAQLHHDELAVRRKLPPLTLRQLDRLPEHLRAEHGAWAQPRPADDAPSHQQRARQLALTLYELGEDTDEAMAYLRRWRFHPAVAHEALTWAWDRMAAAAQAAAIDVAIPAGPTPQGPLAQAAGGR